MKIFVSGTRGVPNIPGGVESHCQQLYPLIVEAGHEVKISRRKPYIDKGLSEWSGIQLVDTYTPRKKSVEAIVHTFLSILEAKKWKADILHLHAIGPAIMVPFARILGLKVVFTNHGPDYDREKWGGMAKLILRAGEKIGGIFSNEVIVISEVIREIVQRRCGRSSNLIYNGVKVPEKAVNTDYVDSLGLAVDGYILAVARFVPEKGLHDLIDAYNRSGLACKLVIAGDSDHDDEYSRSLKIKAAENPDITLTGYVTGDYLHQLYSHARMFVLPSYHEGLPISLLEALSYGVIPLVSDIPANKEVPINEKYFFHCKDIDSLSTKLVQLWQEDHACVDYERLTNLVKSQYDWQKISEQTIKVYKRATVTKS